MILLSDNSDFYDLLIFFGLLIFSFIVPVFKQFANRQKKKETKRPAELIPTYNGYKHEDAYPVEDVAEVAHTAELPDEGIRATEDTAPMEPVKRNKLPAAKRRLRRAIILGEILRRPFE